MEQEWQIVNGWPFAETFIDTAVDAAIRDMMSTRIQSVARGRAARKAASQMYARTAPKWTTARKFDSSGPKRCIVDWVPWDDSDVRSGARQPGRHARQPGRQRWRLNRRAQRGRGQRARGQGRGEGRNRRRSVEDGR